MEMIIVSKKTKETKYRTVATVPKSNINRKADNLYRYSTPIHDHSLPCTGTGTSIKSGGVFIEMMRSCKCQLYMTTHFLVLVQTLQ